MLSTTLTSTLKEKERKRKTEGEKGEEGGRNGKARSHLFN